MSHVQTTGRRAAARATVWFGAVDAIRFVAQPAAAMGLLLALLLATAWPAAATQEYVLPTLFDVTGVAANDVLNIRSAPGTSSAVIGTLSADARDIEVVGYDATGRWARVNTGALSGWTALRHLAYQVDVWNPGTLPPTLHCLGTEPFWSFSPRGDDILFAVPDAPEAVMRIKAVLTTGLFRDPRRSLTAEGGSQRMTAVIVPLSCSDGMSDRVYGLDVTVILQGGGAPEMLTGCCSIAPR